MTPAQRLAELRAKATGTYWERYGFIGHYDLARVRCPIGCDRVDRQKYADVPVHGHDAAFIVYAANHAAAIAVRERELEARIATLECHLDFLGWSSDGIQAARDQLAAKDAEIAKLRAAAKSFLFWFDADGTPVDGFRFQEERVKLEEVIKQSEATDER